MALQDTCVTVEARVVLHDGKLAEFKDVCKKIVDKTASEDRCKSFAIAFNGNACLTREGYVDAEGVLEHLENVGELFKGSMAMANLSAVEIHGPAEEIDKLRQPLADHAPEFYIVEWGFRR